MGARRSNNVPDDYEMWTNPRGCSPSLRLRC